MSKPRDNKIKRLLAECPQDFMDWLIQGAQFTGNRSQEFKSISLDADIMHEAVLHGKRVMFHIEFQSGPDPTMAQRLLEYNVLAHRYYECPVYSCVIYLKKCSVVAQSPLVRVWPDGKEIVRFYFEVILLCEIPYEELMEMELPGLLPLVPLAQGGASREVIEEIIDRLIQLGMRPESELLFLVYGFASLAFEANDDLDWLDRRFAMLRDILNNSPAFQHLRKIAREEGLEEGRQEGREEGREEGRQEGREEGWQEGRQEGRLRTSRYILLAFIQARFPELMPVAKEQVERIKKPETLERLTFKVGMAQTLEEAQDHLLNEDNL